jgi:hypothetical protein
MARENLQWIQLLPPQKKNNPLEPVFVKTSAIMAVCAAGIGLLVLLGWIFNIPILKTNGAGYVTIKANESEKSCQTSS